VKGINSSYRNSKLFSRDFLEDHLPKLPEWQIHQDELKRVREKLHSLFQQALPATSEASLEEELIRPILTDVLGFYYLVQPSAAVFKTHRQPDYALFASEEEKQGAKAFDGDKRLFESALAVADAKAWDVDLDAVGPASQMHDYVLISGLRWGILTNGRCWRLTHRDTVHELDTFFEIDVEELLKADDPASLKYFLLFFHAESFQPGGFLDRVLTQSVEYAQRVGAELKENVYEALRCFCRGFLGGNAELSPEDLSTIHQNALIVLYRILFLLYAESERERELLPLSNTDYQERIGLCALKRDVADQRNWLAETHSLWSRLSDLFRLINQGSESLGIYAYNGGLFDPQLHPLLERWQIGDRYLAEAVELLACTDVEGRRGFLDYSALDVRELGSIYEGLLEHKLILKNGILEWEKDRSQRKKTGSYYTPEYIVQYIVEQTIGPLIDEIQSGLKTDLDELSEKIRRARGENRRLLEQQRDGLFKKARERVLDLKILDPAMGSGHFLVSACDYVARRIAELEAELAGEETEEAVQALKRTVAERCLYGVDLNPLATELAKLSLWLHTVAKGKPLSFLDHHLRIGNSLIGARVKDLERPPSGKAHEIGLWESKLVQDLAKAIGYLDFIKASASTSRSDIEEKKQRWELVNAWIGKYKLAADAWLSGHFGNTVTDEDFQQVLQAAASSHMDEVPDSPAMARSEKIASEKRFFHWELEFPDIFFDRFGRPLENPGFDAVIGNPPYLDSGNMVKSMPEERDFIANTFDAASGNWDLYVPFWELAAKIKNNYGRASLITPNKWLSIGYGRALRKLVAAQVYEIGDFTRCEVFEDAGIFPIVAFVRKAVEKPLRVRVFNKDRSITIEQEVPRAYLEKDQQWGTVLSANFALVDKVLVSSQVVGQICSAEEAFTVSEAYHLVPFLHELEPSEKSYFRFVVTGTIDRYEPLWGLEVAKYLKSEYLKPVVHRHALQERFHRRHEQAAETKLVLSGIRHFESFLDQHGNFLSGISTVILRRFTRGFSPSTILAILNSRFMSFCIWELYGTLAMDGGINFTAPLVSQLPIPRIGFVTPMDERARLLDEGKRLYFAALESLGLEGEPRSEDDGLDEKR